LLEQLNWFCGQDINLVFRGTLTRNTKDVDCTIPFVTGALPICNYSTMADAPVESGCWEFNNIFEAYCEDLDVEVANSVLGLWYDESGKTDFIEVTARSISFEVGDDYINAPNGGGSWSEVEKYKLNVLKTMMRQDTTTDVSIVVDGATNIRAHKCFLIGKSPLVLYNAFLQRLIKLKYTQMSYLHLYY